MNKKAIGFAVVLLVLFTVGTAFAQEVCRVLDVNGKETTDTIRISVSSYDEKTGTVTIAVSSDSGKPVNATIKITVSGTSKNFPVRIEPYQSNLLPIKYGTFPNVVIRAGASRTITADVFGAKCLL